MKCLLDTKAEKLVRLGLDPAAHEGEVSNAGASLMKHWRSRGLRPEDVLGNGQNAEPKPHVFPFGQYKGCTLDEIDSGYLQWALDTLKKLSPRFRAAIEEELRRRK